MTFSLVKAMNAPLHADDGSIHCISVVESSEPLRELSDEAVKTQMFSDLEAKGYAVYGDSCSCEHDCCGCSFHGEIEIVQIDRIYNRVITELMIYRNI